MAAAISVSAPVNPKFLANCSTSNPCTSLAPTFNAFQGLSPIPDCKSLSGLIPFNHVSETNSLLISSMYLRFIIPLDLASSNKLNKLLSSKALGAYLKELLNAS